MEPRLKRAQGAWERAAAAPLFAGWEETPLYSALEGEMGGVWTLDGAADAALAECADFLFLAAGGPESAALLLAAWRRERAGEYRILTARDPALLSLAARVFGGDASPTRRYAFEKGGERFDRQRLASFAASVPAGVVLRGFDRELYRLALRAEWSRDFCSQFRSEDDFLARGIGVAALCGDELAGGASSYTRYGAGIEIQVETRADMRRRGIALACCARLILDCMDRGLYPSWDAANEASVRLAVRLGYRLRGPYEALELYRPCGAV